MNIPNWIHHSKKDQKRKFKPQAMRARREALRQFKKRHMTSPKKRGSFVYWSYTEQINGSQARNQIPTSKITCY